MTCDDKLNMWVGAPHMFSLSNLAISVGDLEESLERNVNSAEENGIAEGDHVYSGTTLC